MLEREALASTASRTRPRGMGRGLEDMDLSKIKDLKDLQALLDLMGRYDLAELEIEGEGHRVRFRKTEATYHVHREISSFPGVPPAQAAGMASGAALPGSPSAPALPSNLKEVTSPMVGSFYRAPSPEAEPYVTEGDVVQPDTILCIIEAMKVMNEIPAGLSGVVREILVKNGESVEFGQPLFRIEFE